MKGSHGKEFWMILIGGMLLSLNAGHLNGTTILQDHPTTTTHMTGNATMLGIAIANLNLNKIFFEGFLLFSYVFGSFISGIMIPYQSFSISFGYGKVFILVSIVLTISALVDIFFTSDFVIYDLFVACAAGMQNGMVSRYSGNILRIGHVTGACTDIGVYVGRYLMGTQDNIWRIKILLSLVLTFFLGGFFAQKLHPILGKYQLLLSAGISFSIGIFYIVYLRISEYQLTLRQSIIGFNKFDDNPVIRESIEMNFDNEIKSVYPDDYFYDEDYNLTQEEALQLHCKVNGELIQSELTELTESFGNMADYPEASPSLNDDSLPRLTSANIKLINETSSPISLSHSHPSLPPLPPQPPSTPLHPLQNRNPTEFSLILVGSMLLALNGGIINSISANSGRGYFVSHVSGSTSNAAVELGSQNYGQMSIYLSLIFSFTFGSFLVGLMVPSSVFRFGMSYSRVFLFEGLLLLIASLWNLSHESSLYFYYICSCACGVQNAIVTKYSGGIIRTTHPTGGLTDIGSILGRMVTGHYTDLWQLKVLVPLVLCFITGGVIGTGLHKIWGRDSLLVNVGFIFLVSFCYLLHLKNTSRTELTYQQLLFGKYTYPFVKQIRKTLSNIRSTNNHPS